MMVVFFSFGIIGTMQGVSVTPILVLHDVSELITHSTFQKTGNEGKERLIIQGDPQLFILCLVVISSLLVKEIFECKKNHILYQVDKQEISQI